MSTDTPVRVETLPIDEIKPYWRNPRKQSDDAIDKLMDSIRRYGYQNPIIVDEDYVVITGHTRLMALRRLDWTDIPVLVSNMDPKQAKEYRIIDNRTSEQTSWDRDKLLLELREFVDPDVLELHFPEVDLTLDFGSDNLDLDTSDLDAAAAALDSLGNHGGNKDPRQVRCPHCYETFDIDG